MKTVIAFCMFSLLPIASPAWAATAPKPSGAYAFASNEMCEAQLAVTKSGSGNVTDVKLSKTGMMEAGNGIITFTPTSATGGTFTITNSTLVDGGSLRLGSVSSFPWHQITQNQSNVPYSFTATTVTVGSGAQQQVYQLVCGNVVSGVCGSVFLVRRDTTTVPNNTDCVNSISAVKR